MAAIDLWSKKQGVITSYSIHYTKLYDGVGQAGEGFPGRGGDLPGMVEMGVDPQGVVLLEHGHQLVGHPVGEDHLV